MPESVVRRVGRLFKRFIRRPHVTQSLAPASDEDCLPATVPNLVATTERRQIFDRLWGDYRRGLSKPSDPMRILQFMHLMEIANRAPDGDYIELGTHWGLMAKVIFKLMEPTKTLYCLDTFEGFVESDLKIEKQIYKNNWHVGNFQPTSTEMVGNYIGDGKCPVNLILKKGWFPDSFAGLENRAWRFIHVDFDLYQPIKRALELCWPNLVPGGVIVIHDYGCDGFPAARKAVDDFFDGVGLTPVILGDMWSSVAVIKPKPASASACSP